MLLEKLTDLPCSVPLFCEYRARMDGELEGNCITISAVPRS